MKTLKILFSLLLFFCTSSVSSQNKDVIAGKWLNQDGTAHITIYQNSGKYMGRIVWLKEPEDAQGKPKMDKNNPDESLRRRPIIGTEILKGFSYSGKGLWEGGSIYDPKTGRTYSCKISLADQNRINVRGFVGFSMLGRTESWSRVK